MKRVLLIAFVGALLAGCAPGVYTVDWNLPRERTVTERVVTERVIERVVEVPVYVPTPAPPVVVPPPITIPEPPVPPVACRIKSMPERSPWLSLIKCDGSPTQLVPRP